MAKEATAASMPPPNELPFTNTVFSGSVGSAATV